MSNELQILFDLFTAFGIGLLIGIERGWKGRAKEEGNRIAGIRTFTLAGILGGISGQLSLVTGSWLLGAIFFSFTIMITVGHYIGTKESSDIGITSQVALLITFILGAWAAYISNIYVFGVAVVVIAILGYKPEIHKAIKNIETEEIYAGIKLLVISVILLPVLPDKGYGPFEALNPYWLWWMVVLITGLSFIGYVSIKHFGDRIGILLTAISGALASSTAVTLSLAHMAKRTQVTPMFMAGILIASAIMLVRIVIEVAVVNPALLQMLWIPIAAMLTPTVLGTLWLWKSQGKPGNEKHEPLTLHNPFQISMALKFGILLGVVILLAEAMKEWFGDQGIYVLSVLSGLMDVDAITLSLSRIAINNLSETTAVRGIILAAITNTLVKGILFAFITNIKVSLKLILIIIASCIAGLAGIMVL
ncbi:MAG: hypothetical protein A3I13_04025 [Gammaproteobacteria bacterium RIFCSPLOWO2_02_FULL_47_50]|nr:MAG: hypothetical protein A2993_01055 [Gammaproteobacteria bacterium RIFCSPLOWO2_01_FULL_47_190]OGT79432.1 MAG: hypothetical protein A3I13_04025 [Gammaproteobacteria bacterium RIFCSPLOWO2_02_FULL_47_50]OGT84159.1 MAG: hypothetical protein A3G42_00090 [Gammaproteobacteria bacterium RIFCSPLOWO2_12_FULL_47_76]